MSEMYELQPRARAAPSSQSSDSPPGALTPDEDDDARELSDDMPSDLRAGDTLSLDDQELDRRTVRKLDVILLPFLALLFLFNSLDKSNIGSAESAHFTTDAGLDREDVNTAVALFFVFFVALQPLGAALGRKYGMKRWVPACMALWGLCTTLHIWVHAAWQLYVLRITIATLEAGFYPITVSYLSLFYTRFEFGRRLAIFYGQAAIAGAFGGVLSYAVFSHFPVEDANPTTSPSRSSWHSWQILFLIEGLTTMTIALTGFFWLPERPKTSWFLNPDEREWAEKRIKRDREGEAEHNWPKHSPSALPTREEPGNLEAPLRSAHSTEEAQGLLSVSPHGQGCPSPHESSSSLNTTDHGLSAHDVLSALTSWKVYYLLVFNILSAIPSTAFSIFLPLVLSPLSSTPALANLLTAPPYLCAAATLYAFTSWSDRIRDRTKPILVSLAIVLVGFAGTIFLPSSSSPTASDPSHPPHPHSLIPRYLALCVLLSGTFIASPLTVAWLTNNLPQPGKRALALGLNGWGNVAGVVASALFSPRFARDGYRFSFAWAAVAVACAAAGFAGFRALLKRENAERAALLAGWSEDEVEAERRWGRGPVRRRRWGGGGGGGGGGERGGGAGAVADGVLEWLERRGNAGGGVAGKMAGWIGEWRGMGREGDERMTFVYGL
ncbi:mfs general substrate transporter [Diplodia corticola]|uniref:Mfs general substrate transporter n=1 Tax=Diplodia corticola TaxID=236234 RepID=A0A1J9RLN3_9PEZI|nr:mfs general substrate transporter [Diplodia corticola]OJD28836.1 mfs general substrate transporter [Diplodia corticola]